jgi:uncharacterized protein YxjI
LKNKHIALHKSFYGVAPDGKEVFQVKGHFSRMYRKHSFSCPFLDSQLPVLSHKSTVHFTNASDGREIELDVKGDWLDRSASITCGGLPVARIGRSFFNVREIFADKQTYFVTVAPGVDLALIAAVCICLDESENEK